MPIVTSGAITITDVNDGVSSRLSLENFLVVTDSAGANGVFTGASTTMSIMLGATNDSANWTVTAAPSAGVTGSLATRTYTVTALSTDTGYVDLTATRSGYPSITLRFSLSKAKQGTTGTPGSNGSNGVDGARGTIQTAVATTGTVWSDAEANAAIVAAGGVAPQRGDVVTLFNTSAGFSQSRVRTTGGAWAALAAFFGGDVLVDGTVVANKLAANSVIASKISASAVTAGKIAADAVTANEIAAGAVTAQHMLLAPGNMISNSKFSTGDFSDWRNWTTPGQQSVVTRATAGVPAGAPTLYVAKFATTAAQAISAFSGSPAYSDVGSDRAAMQFLPGRKYRVTIQAAEDATFAATSFQVIIYYRKTDGTLTSAGAAINAAPALNSTWQEFTGIFTAPADVVCGWAYVYAVSNAAGSVYWTNLSVREMAAAELVVDGTITGVKIAANTITGDLLATTSLITLSAQIGDGLITNAKISGAIQSTNFVTGVSGWKIDKSGAAEFNGPVISRQIQVDTGDFALPTPISCSNLTTFTLEDTYWIETNTPISAWVGTSETFIALVGRKTGTGFGSITASTANTTNFPAEVMWGFEASVVPLTRWSGSQNLFIKVNFYTKRVLTASSFTLTWKLMKVT